MEMEIKIDEGKGTAIYEQIFEQIAGAIQSGLYQEGKKLPSESEFCRNSGLAKGTVRKAFDLLETEGYVRRLHGSGTYVLNWREEYRKMNQFADACRKAGIGEEEAFRLLREACGRRFSSDTLEEAAVIDCTPEIGGDIAGAMKEIWNFSTKFYPVERVRSGELIPEEALWVTTRNHYEEILSEAEEMGKKLMQVEIYVPAAEAEKIAALDDECMLGIVYDSQDFLMHISHTLALLGRHNTFYLCQKEEWCDKKKAIRPEEITWIVSNQEESIIRQMEEMRSRFIAFSYGVEEKYLEQIRTFMEQRR